MVFRSFLSPFIAFMVFLFPFGVAKGQSFDCATARIKAEKTICSGGRLIKLDDRLALSYGRLKSGLAKGKARRLLVRRQKKWLAQRNMCKSNRRCLRSQYHDRIAEIEGQFEHRERKLALEHPGPSFDCVGARAAAELTICRYRHLSNLDRRMDGVFRSALMKSRSNGDRRAMRLGQGEWIRARNFCRFDRACLRRSYDNRISYLGAVIADLSRRRDVQPSYNCKYAKLRSEKAICRSERLARLDVEGNDLYKRSLGGAPSKVMRRDLKSSESNWLKRRDRCDSSRNCLENSYLDRIVYLQNILYYFSSLANPTHRGPSFACETVRNDAERVICSRKNLSRLDRQLASIYGTLQKDIPRGARGTLRKAQAGWLGERNDCVRDRKCLRRKYRIRISELEAQHDEIKRADWTRQVTVSPSFNCKYARLPAEKAICDNSVLAQLDREMASTYYALRDGTPNTRRRGKLKYKQKLWLGERNNCGYRVNCLRDKYESRLYQLERALDS